MKVVLVQPRGFCAGVVRAIDVVEEALRRLGPPVYVRRQIVHNTRVIEDLTARGARFVDELDEVPGGAPVILSAHGSPRWVVEWAAERHLIILDGTCPLVSKVHRQIQRFIGDGYSIVLVGHAGHDEVTGSLGQAEAGVILLVESVRDVARLHVADPTKVACVTQTTLNVEDVFAVIDALRARFPALVIPRVQDVCYATRNRQEGARWLGEHADVVLVFGSSTSSNTARLVEVVRSVGRPVYRIDSIDEVQPHWFDQSEVVGITAGASTPEVVIDQAADWFRARGATVENEILREENLSFAGVDLDGMTFAVPAMANR